MSIFDTLLSWVAPHDCLGCAAEGSLLCRGCAAGLPDAPPECYFCRQPSPDSLTCAACYRRVGLRQVIVGTLYAGLAKRLVWRLKFGGAQAAAHSIIDALPPVAAPDLLVMPVPTATRRVRRRGYDQAALLAREFARQHKLSYIPCLHRLGQAHQVGADRKERLRQLAEAFIVARPERIRGKRILLIDDVITTGATFEAAALVLRAAGAADVSALAFARGA